MDDSDELVVSARVVELEVQIPLWTIATMKLFTLYFMAKEVQIPLWTIATSQGVTYLYASFKFKFLYGR